jgi:hypothetical protein
MVKEEREYVMLNECKLNNSYKSGNKSLVNKYIDLNESLVKANRCLFVYKDPMSSLRSVRL